MYPETLKHQRHNWDLSELYDALNGVNILQLFWSTRRNGCENNLVVDSNSIHMLQPANIFWKHTMPQKKCLFQHRSFSGLKEDARSQWMPGMVSGRVSMFSLCIQPSHPHVLPWSGSFWVPRPGASVRSQVLSENWHESKYQWISSGLPGQRVHCCKFVVNTVI